MALRSRDDVAVRIGAETSGLDRGLSDTQTRLRGFALGAVDVAKKIALIGAAAVAAGGAILVHLVRNSMEAVDAQSKLARQIGATTQAVQTLDRAAELAGVENLSRNAQLMTQRLGEAATGTGTAKDALAALGLTVDGLMALDADERFIAIAEAMDRLGMTAEQRANVLRDFGFRGTEMAGLLENGAAAIRQAQRDVEDFGVALSDVDAQAIERAGDEMSTFGTVVDGVSNQLSASLAPIIAVVSKRLTDSARGTAGFREEIDDLVDQALDGIGWLLDALQEVWGAIITGRTVVLGLKTMFLEAWATVIEGAELALIEVRRLYNTIAEAVGLGLIPEVDSGRLAWIEEQRQAAVEAREAAEASAQSWRDLMSGPRPSEWIRGMREEAAALRDELSGSVGAGPVAGEDGDTGGPANDNDDLQERLAGRLEAFDDALASEEEREQRSFDKRRAELAAFLDGGLITQAGYFDRLAELEAQHDARIAEIRDAGATERLARLNDELMSQEERQNAWYETRIAMLQEFTEKGLITQEEAAARAEEIERQHMERLVALRQQGMSELQKFTQMSYREQAATVLGELTGLTSGVARENKRMFQLNKIAGIANAIVNAYTGISKTMAAYPYPLNIGMAAAHAAAAFAQVQAIRSASFGDGGGSAASVRGSTPSTPVTNVPAASSGASGSGGAVVNLTLQGERFGREEVRRLIEQINEAIGDGARLKVA